MSLLKVGEGSEVGEVRDMTPVNLHGATNGAFRKVAPLSRETLCTTSKIRMLTLLSEVT